MRRGADRREEAGAPDDGRRHTWWFRHERNAEYAERRSPPVKAEAGTNIIIGTALVEWTVVAMRPCRKGPFAVAAASDAGPRQAAVPPFSFPHHDEGPARATCRRAWRSVLVRGRRGGGMSRDFWRTRVDRAAERRYLPAFPHLLLLGGRAGTLSPGQLSWRQSVHAN
eukprot:ctg_999.g498